MSQQQMSAKKQSGNYCFHFHTEIASETELPTELQTQYSNYKETLQAIAQKIGDVEQEAEEHK